MYLTGKFQAKKLEKKVKDNKVYRNLWIKDESDEDYQVSFDEGLLSVLKQNGVYQGVFEFSQYQRYQGYGTEDRIRLVDAVEVKDDWSVSGGWDI